MPKVGDIPGLKKLPKANGCFTWYWAVSQIARDAEGFQPRTARLWHGPGEPSPAEMLKIKATASRLCQDLEDWRLRNRCKPLTPPKLRCEKLEKRSPRGSIYFVRAGERVRIGFTRNVKRRISQLQAFFPEPLELLLTLPGSLLAEKELHRCFADHNITREWFAAAPPLLAYIEKMTLKNISEPIFSESPTVRIAGS